MASRFYFRKRRRTTITIDVSEDVLWIGSDDEDYGSREQRREACRRARVQFESSQHDGAPPFLLSASLKGPFDAESGWMNPWRSKGRAAAANAELEKQRQLQQQKSNAELEKQRQLQQQKSRQRGGRKRSRAVAEEILGVESGGVPETPEPTLEPTELTLESTEPTLEPTEPTLESTNPTLEATSPTPESTPKPQRDEYWSQPQDSPAPSEQSAVRAQQHWAASLKERKPLRKFKAHWLVDEATTKTPTPAGGLRHNPPKTPQEPRRNKSAGTEPGPSPMQNEASSSISHHESEMAGPSDAESITTATSHSITSTMRTNTRSDGEHSYGREATVEETTVLKACRMDESSKESMSADEEDGPTDESAYQSACQSVNQSACQSAYQSACESADEVEEAEGEAAKEAGDDAKDEAEDEAMEEAECIFTTHQTVGVDVGAPTQEAANKPDNESTGGPTLDADKWTIQDAEFVDKTSIHPNGGVSNELEEPTELNTPKGSRCGSVDGDGDDDGILSVVNTALRATTPRRSSVYDSARDMFVWKNDASFCYQVRIPRAQCGQSSLAGQQQSLGVLSSSPNADNNDKTDSTHQKLPSDAPLLLTLESFSQFAVHGIGLSPSPAKSLTLTHATEISRRPASQNSRHVPLFDSTNKTNNSGMHQNDFKSVDSEEGEKTFDNQEPTAPHPANLPANQTAAPRDPNATNFLSTPTNLSVAQIDNTSQGLARHSQTPPLTESPAADRLPGGDLTAPNTEKIVSKETQSDHPQANTAVPATDSLERFSPWNRISQIARLDSAPTVPETTDAYPETTITATTTTTTTARTDVTNGDPPSIHSLGSQAQLVPPPDPTIENMGLPFDPARECDSAPPPPLSSTTTGTPPDQSNNNNNNNSNNNTPRKANGDFVAPLHQSPWAPEMEPSQYPHWAQWESPSASVPQSPWGGQQQHHYQHGDDSPPPNVPRQAESAPSASWKDVVLNDVSSPVAMPLPTINVPEPTSPSLSPPTARVPGSCPTTPLHLASSRPSTPKQSTPSEPSYRIKPFSAFVSPSPNHRVRKSRRSLKPALSSGRTKRSSSTWSLQSRRRVSFVPADGDEHNSTDDEAIKAPHFPPETPSKNRRHSPPPDTAAIADISEQDLAAAFSKHFSTVSRRVRQRLVPSASQQARESPAHDAMARAFILADSLRGEDGGGDSDVDMAEHEYRQSPTPISRNKEPADHESEIDIVDEVVSNIDSFLNPMDDDEDMPDSTPRVRESQQSPWARGVLGI